MSEDADSYEAYGQHPDIAREREEVKRKFRESLEALVKKVNKEIAYNAPEHIRGALDEAAKDFFKKIPDRPLYRRIVDDERTVSFPEGHHGRWELLTPDDVRFLIDCGYLID